MSGADDRERQKREAQRQVPEDSRLLHPGNEGHDAERARARLEEWAGEEPPEGRDARALRALQEREAASARPPEPAHASAPPPEDRDAHHVRGGEPKKHPRPPAETTPEPGRGPHRVHPTPGEPPEVTLGDRKSVV